MACRPASLLLFGGLLLLLLAALEARAQPPSSMRPTPEIGAERAASKRECPQSCSPNRSGAPRKHVCGTDGRTYQSVCHLRRQQCQHPNANVKVNYRGKCRPDKASGNKGSNSQHSNPPCQEARRFHVSGDTDNKFVPQCEKDGTFQAMQCFKEFCWCVDTLTGNAILNSYLENSKPDCSKVTRRKSPAPQPREKKRPQSSNGRGGLFGQRRMKKECDGADRMTFNKNLLNLIIVDMRHLPIASRTDDEGEVILEKTNDPETQRRILELKFNTMDEDEDDFLEKKEYRNLRKLARTTVTPRRCSRTFVQRCDRDNDTKISRDEWLHCLGLDSHRGLGPVLSLPKEDGSSTEQDSSEGRGCLHDRKAAMEQTSGNNYVPQCTDDGKFQKTQCYTTTGYCFCVDEDTGKMVAGSIVLKKDPQCESRPSNSGSSPRSIEKCPNERKRLFLREFKALMRAKVDWSGAQNEGDSIKLEKIIAASFFDSMDKNKDKALDKKEWKEFRKIVEERASLRQCGKKFLKFCDSNDDNRVTPAEWDSCLAASKAPQSPAHFKVLPGHGSTDSPPRQGANPLETILMADD